MTYIFALCFCVCLLVLNDSMTFTDGSYFTVQSGMIDRTGYTALHKHVMLCSQLTQTSALNLKKQHRLMFDCMIKYIRHCVDYFVKPVTRNVTFCGRLAVASTSLHIHIYVNVLQQHVVLYRFVVFDLYRTFDQCGPDYVQITDVTSNQIHNYCGRRIPWSMVTNGQSSQLIIGIHDNLHSTLLLFYSAQRLSDISSIVKEIQWTLPHPPLQTVYSQIVFAHGIVYCTSPHLTIRVDIQWKQQYKLMTVYDGPGRRSSSILKITPSSYIGTYFALSSAHCVYILIENAPNYIDETLFNIGTYLSRPAKCPYVYNRFKGLTRIRIHFHNSEHNYVCVKEIHEPPILHYRLFPLLHFVVFTFDGPDTVAALDQGCDYGGVFIQEFGKNSSNFRKSLCRSSRHTVIYSDTTKFKLFVIWYRGYHLGRPKLVVRSHYRTCPTTYLTTSFQNVFNTELTCRHIVCEVGKCKIHLIRNNGPIGPIVLKFAAAQNLKTRPAEIDVKMPIMCNSKTNLMYLAAENWPLKSDIYVKRIKYNYNKTNSKSVTENIDFLHNATASFFTCSKSPAGLSMYFSICGKFSPYLHDNFVLSPPLLECSRLISTFQNVTIFNFEMADFKLDIIVKYETDCCKGHEIILHEKTLNDDIVYEYSATLVDMFNWRTHASQCGVRLRIIAPATCTSSCKMMVTMIKQLKVSTITALHPSPKFIHYQNSR